MFMSHQPDTDELLDRATGGDRLAVEGLLDRHRERLLRMIAIRLDGRLAGRVDPSDVVQETLAAAAGRLDDYLRDRPVPFYPWLRQLAWDRLHDLHRRHLSTGKRSVLREEALGVPDASAVELAAQFVARDTGPLKRLLREELRARVRATLAQLSRGDREVLILRHLEHLSAAESAAVLEIGVDAAKKRYVRAVRRLRRFLDDLTWGDAR